MAELLYWTVLDCTGVPNKVTHKCIVYITCQKPINLAFPFSLLIALLYVSALCCF